VYRSRFNGNATGNGLSASGGEGGGIYSAGALDIINALVADNYAVGYGSGIAVDGARLNLTQATLVANLGGDGTGLSINGSAIITNSMIVSQTTGLSVNGGATVYVNGVLWSGNSVNYDGGGVITVTQEYTGSPAFRDPATADYHLTAVSAAINRGVADGVLVDLDGTPRYGAPDLGAYEYQLPWKFYLPLVRRNGL
jgi:hypothetical protein